MKNHLLSVMLLSCMSSFHAMELFDSWNGSGSSVTDEEEAKQPVHSPQMPSQRTTLINAIGADNDMGVVIALIDYPDLNVSGTRCGHDDPPLCVAASHGFRTVLECLLVNGAVVNVCDGNGDSPLHCAVTFGHLQVAKVLFKAGASLEQRNNEEQTILHKALIKAPINIDLIRWILKKGALVNAQDKKGNSGAHYACMHDRKDLLELLTARDDVIWGLENNEGIIPKNMPLLAYYISPLPSPSPEPGEYTTSYANLDDLFGTFFTDQPTEESLEIVTTEDQKELKGPIETYYCLPKLEVDEDQQFQSPLRLLKEGDQGEVDAEFTSDEEEISWDSE